METLVHLNKDVPVQADDPDQAMERAKALMHVAFPDAALVDPVNYADLDAGQQLRCPTCGSEDPNHQEGAHYLRSGECHDGFHDAADGG